MMASEGGRWEAQVARIFMVAEEQADCNFGKQEKGRGI